MRLDEARGLKQELLARILAAPAPRLAAFAVAAQRLADLSRIHRTVALGVAPGGRIGYRLAVRVQHRVVSDDTVEEIRKRAAGEVDVRYVGRIGKLAPPAGWTRKRARPLRMGVSIGHVAITAGTLGAFVRRTPNGPAYVLSNNHVLANENAARTGDAIVQPGPYDHGVAADQVATLSSFVRLRTRGANKVDAAIARLGAGISFEAVLLGDGSTLAGVTDVLSTGEDAVAKTGRTTAYTEGRITAFELDNVVVGYDLGNLRFDNQLEIESSGEGPFSQGGDSGSLIVTRPGHAAAALLFAGSDQGGRGGLGLTYANPIGAVLKALKVDLAG